MFNSAGAFYKLLHDLDVQFSENKQQRICLLLAAGACLESIKDQALKV
jgi:hypothetical protein